MKKTLPLLLALAMATPSARAADPSLENFASGALSAASAGASVAARAFGARRAERAAEQAKAGKPEVELWVYNTEDGPSYDHSS
ncbi:MAG: hypothetical protein FD126_2972 [Elusimicrobia bacterium]|nr:MAG: hypothetical protein FD126_2972 [Elusimicrobiota bacterium]